MTQDVEARYAASAGTCLARALDLRAHGQLFDDWIDERGSGLLAGCCERGEDLPCPRAGFGLVPAGELAAVDSWPELAFRNVVRGVDFGMIQEHEEAITLIYSHS